MTSSVFNYKYENGRRYHGFREGNYFMPNDEKEQDRLDLFHHISTLVLDGACKRPPTCTCAAACSDLVDCREALQRAARE